MTQEELAESIDRAVNGFSRWMASKSSWPSGWSKKVS